MKKFVVFALTSLLMFSASAATLKHGGPKKASDIRKHRMERVQFPTKPSAPAKKKITAMRKVDDLSVVQGRWEFLVGDYYFYDYSTFGELVVEYDATVYENDVVVFTDPTQWEEDVVAIYDEAKGTFTFPASYLYPIVFEEDGEDVLYYLYQEPFIYNWQTDDLDYQTIVATYDAKSGYMAFAEDNGIAWNLYTDEEGENFDGYYWIYDFLSATKSGISGGEDLGDWNDCGNATLIDPWVVPALGVNQYDNPYEVPLQQNAANKNLYRLVNPYMYGPGEAYNMSETGGYIVFDVTDPDHVFFHQADAGWANSGPGITKFFAYNHLGFFVAYTGYTPEQIIAIVGDDIPYTTFKDGVLTLSYIVNEDDEIIYDANYGIQSAPTGGYTWTDSKGNTADMTGKIIFPDSAGIEGVKVENSDSTPIFYNLQGSRVENPSSGILIRVKNGKAEKVFMK